MAYELNIRDGDGRTDRESFVTDLTKGLSRSGAVTSASENEAEWKVEGTRIRLTIRREEPVWRVDAALPWGAVAEEVDTAVEQLLATAERQGLRVFDPQLGRAVVKGDQTAVFNAFIQGNAYHIEVGGRFEDARQGLAAASEVDHDRTSVQVKVLLGIVGAGALAFFLFRACVLQPTFEHVRALGETESSGPPPGWIERHTPDPPLRSPYATDEETEVGVPAEADRPTEPTEAGVPAEAGEPAGAAPSPAASDAPQPSP